MEFTKRIEAPSYTDKNWIQTEFGGLNSCILIEDNSVLPNCVGYAWGRAYELLNEKPRLSRGNAEDWYNYDDGYERSSEPMLGAIICWKKGEINNSRDGAGHVAVVEEIYSDGSILTSNSSYNGERFWIKKYQKPYILGSSYDLQGFIYLPVDFNNQENENKTVEEIAKEVIAGLWGNNPERKERLQAAGYNYDLVQTQVNNILSTDKDIYYTVKSGDSLSKIAKNYNTTWQKLYENNKKVIGNDPNLIKAGQIIVIK